MNKRRQKSGFTLIEMMCALLILVILTMGISVSVTAGTGIYRDTIFESESATLADILNTALGDVLRHSIDIREVTAVELAEQGSEAGIPGFDDSSIRYVFTSLDYGIQDAYFHIPDQIESGTIQMKNLRNSSVLELVNTGAYPDLEIYDFQIQYSPRTGPGIEGGYFRISYQIRSADGQKTRQMETIIRAMND